MVDCAGWLILDLAAAKHYLSAASTDLSGLEEHLLIHKVKKTQRKRHFILSVAIAFSSLLCIAHAQETGSYRVVNVRSGSALNVRAEHNSASADIGSASPGTTVNVVDFSPNGHWAKIKWEQSYGWVSKRFLSLEQASDVDVAALASLQSKQAQPAYTAEQLAAASLAVEAATTAPAMAALRQTDASQNPNISCAGNGPNWNLTLDKFGALVFQAPDQNSLYATTQWRQSINNKDTYAFAVSDIKGTLLKKTCIDRRSNQNFEWQLELNTNGFGGQEQLSGCCTSQ